ncbi:MAG: hypothetical protein U5K69_10165 [Balneolaceae bacterium]|nr:hypothetical protein [Balneolaceae bacterium]
MKLWVCFLKRNCLKKIIPSLDMPLEDLEEFAGDILERFENPYIKHELSAIALNSVSKFRVRVLPSLLSYHERNKELPLRLTFALAALIRFYKGTWQGEAIPINDSEDVVAFMKEAWSSNNYNDVATKILTKNDFWHQDLTEITGLAEQVTLFLESMEQHGVSKSLNKLVSEAGSAK